MLIKRVPVDPGASSSGSAAVAFASFRLDMAGGRLLRNADEIPLRAKTWAVLLYLAGRPGVLVSKDELLDTLWPNIAVTPDTLSKSIGEIRTALGDDSRAPRFIETVHRRGFRFIAETRPAPAAEPAPHATGRGAVERERSDRPLVGRDSELEHLAARLALAAGAERQIVFVTGPAGIGKTALVETFRDSLPLRQAGAPLWIGHAGSLELHGPGEPYLPVLEAIERLARRPDAQRLRALLRRTAPTWLAQMPRLLGDSDAKTRRRWAQPVHPERMLRELATLIEELTSELTLVLVLEDLHWCDPSTVDLLALLGQRRDPARLLLIGTYRPAAVAVSEHVLGSAVRTLQARRQCVELPLLDLGEDAVQRYLAARFPGHEFPPALARRIHAHTGGHPLFVVGIVDHIVSRGWILDTAPGWGLSTPPERMDLGVPDDVRRMIDTQIQGLGPPDRGLLEVASMVGNELAASVVARVLGDDLDDVERRCEALARTQRVLRAAGTIEWPDGSVERRYAFTHELYRQVVYEEIPVGRRARLHQRVASALAAG